MSLPPVECDKAASLSVAGAFQRFIVNAFLPGTTDSNVKNLPESILEVLYGRD